MFRYSVGDIPLLLADSETCLTFAEALSSHGAWALVRLTCNSLEEWSEPCVEKGAALVLVRFQNGQPVESIEVREL
jgi:hypothetical protein